MVHIEKSLVVCTCSSRVGMGRGREEREREEESIVTYARVSFPFGSGGERHSVVTQLPRGDLGAETS